MLWEGPVPPWGLPLFRATLGVWRECFSRDFFSFICNACNQHPLACSSSSGPHRQQRQLSKRFLHLAQYKSETFPLPKKLELQPPSAVQIQHVRSRKGVKGVCCREEIRALGSQDGFCECLLHTHRQKGPPSPIVAMLHRLFEIRRHLLLHLCLTSCLMSWSE